MSHDRDFGEKVQSLQMAFRFGIMSIMSYILVFIGGGIGAVARYWLQGAVYRIMPADFPYGTFLVNLVGSFAIGFLMSSFEERFLVTPGLRLFLTIGILGGFTTFSSFSYETIALFRDGSFALGLLNAAASLCLCLGATWLGLTVGKIV